MLCTKIETNRNARRKYLPVILGILSLAAVANAEEFPGLGPRGNLMSVEFEHKSAPVLQGQNSRMQLIVTGLYSSGQRHDLTHDVTYTCDQPKTVRVSPTGILTPMKDGTATITARDSSGKTATVKVTMQQCAQELPVNFVNEIVPIFTRLGCNTGGCHGKSDGQNGFRLSLLGFYPEDDYDYLVHESRGRRIFEADPEFSLLLQKPSNVLPHGGGKRMSPGMYEWDLIVSWIRQGMPFGSEDDPVLERIEVVPPVREMNFNSSQQLSILGHYSDGSHRDITQLASFEANQPEMAVAESSGLVSVAKVPGEAAVMVRFQGQVGVFRAVIPQGSTFESTIPERTFVDRLVLKRLKQLGIPPSRLCNDETFIRRITIDITGKLPTLQQTQAFLKDQSSDKRDRLVDKLLSSPGYAEYFANKWSAVLRNKRRNGNDVAYTYRFHAWIRQAFEENMPYDQFVRSVLTATGEAQTHPPVAWYREVATSSQQMEDTAQLFLGLRLGCAKCHHHPFERWSQQDYYRFQAFFSQVGLKVSRFNPQTNKPDMVYLKGNIPTATNPRTKQAVKPTGLGGEPLDIQPYEDARHALVDWMAEPENPFFARAFVNRNWKHFFGRGIVDPEDDLRVTNPPSNPELLDALADHFVKSEFNIKDLLRVICTSSVYHLSSEPTELNASDRQNFSSFYPRRMAAEVLYDSINQVASVPARFNGVPQGTTAVQLPDNGFTNYFLQVFGKPESESACECERSPEANLAQSLHLLNSSDVQGRLQSGNGLAMALSRDEERSIDERITEAYLRAFSRQPQPDELDLIRDHLSNSSNAKQAWEDVLWAIFNAKEFQFVR